MRQMKGIFVFLVMLLCMAFCMGAAAAEEAKDITEECKISVSVYANEKKNMFDDANLTMWETPKRSSYIEVKTPEDQPAQGVYIRWGQDVRNMMIQVPGENENEWVEVQRSTDGYFNQFIAFAEPLTHFRVQTVEKSVVVGIIKFQVLGEGEIPDWVQQWQPFEGKADMMVLVAHPDDELLYMGGVIPYYNTVEGKNVIVVYIARMGGFRKVELLDGLWHCGVRSYPEVPGKKFKDQGYNTRTQALNVWGDEKLLEHVTELIRKYQPDVIVTHDVNGEYGHGAHKACCWAVQKCVELAANEKKYMESAKEYGPWQVKKAYIHLYEGEQGQIDFDWRQPMESFQGKTIHEITTEAFALHKTQAASGRFVVEDHGKYDNSLFGLFYSTVGPDTGINDMFENIDQ